MSHPTKRERDHCIFAPPPVVLIPLYFLKLSSHWERERETTVFSSEGHCTKILFSVGQSTENVHYIFCQGATLPAKFIVFLSEDRSTEKVHCIFSRGEPTGDSPLYFLKGSTHWESLLYFLKGLPDCTGQKPHPLRKVTYNFVKEQNSEKLS